MRSKLVLGFTLLASAVVVAAEKPIPQDAARMEAHYRERLGTIRLTLVDAYDRVGRKDPRWDAPARETLELAARGTSPQLDPDITQADIHSPAKRAIDAGCDDPLILFFYGVTSRDENSPGVPEYQRRLRVADEAMRDSGYPPVRRAMVLLERVLADTWKVKLTEEERREGERGLEAVLDLLPRSLAEDPRGEEWNYRWYEIIDNIIDIQRRMSGDYRAAFDWADSRLAKVSGAETLRLPVKGSFYLNWGWEARGSDTADTVSEDQFRTFRTRLAEARDALEAAWKAEPFGTTVPNLMLIIERGIGGGDREAMEKWFDRAMRANGNNQRACLSKLEWLDPRWYGDERGEQMVAFARQCAATGNARASIMFVGVIAHHRQLRTIDKQEWKGYMMSPEVWADFAKIYPEHLKSKPRDHVARSMYAMDCYLSEHYREAHEQFQILGDNLTEWKSNPKWPLEELKKYRKEVARYLAEEKSRSE